VEFAQSIVQVQNELADQVTNIVELVVDGRLEIPDMVCVEQSFVDVNGSPVPNVSGIFVGTFEQCGAGVNGLFSLQSTEELSIRRRFDGEWRAGQLDLNLAFPYSYTLDVGQAACVDMVAQLVGDANRLQGNWSSSNCVSGGLIDLVRE